MSVYAFSLSSASPLNCFAAFGGAIRLPHSVLRLFRGLRFQCALRTYLGAHTSPVRSAGVGRAVLLGSRHSIIRHSSVLERLDTSQPPITSTHRFCDLQHRAHSLTNRDTIPSPV